MIDDSLGFQLLRELHYHLAVPVTTRSAHDSQNGTEPFKREISASAASDRRKKDEVWLS
jgi:hypothetical protein